MSGVGWRRGGGLLANIHASHYVPILKVIHPDIALQLHLWSTVCVCVCVKVCSPSFLEPVLNSWIQQRAGAVSRSACWGQHGTHSLMCCQDSEALWESGSIILGLTSQAPCRYASLVFQLKLQLFIYSDKSLRKSFVKIFLLSLMNNNSSFKSPSSPKLWSISVPSFCRRYISPFPLATSGPRDLLK